MEKEGTMNVDPPLELPENMTYGESLGTAMEITDPDKAKEYFEALVQREMKYFGKTREEAEANTHSNLGYYAGYYSDEVQRRVYRLYGSIHPIFGTPVADPPTPEEAFKLGMEMGHDSAYKKEQS
jgi:hypothetical protein